MKREQVTWNKLFLKLVTCLWNCKGKQLENVLLTYK